MEQLFAPWRMEYILSPRKGGQCIFCPVAGHSDKERLIIHRTPFCLVMFNRYPYSYAHLMIAPVRHVQELSKLKPEEMGDIFHHLGQATRILKEAFRPDGFNIGMNLGKVAGAGVLHHLHFHIIPRWRGDMNFMPALSDVRIIPEHLEQTFQRLLPHFKKLKV
jgi:ATP adenylyltransferase